MKWLIGFFVIVATGSNAQVLDNRHGEAFTDEPFFNEQFIKANRLKKLEGTYVYKKQGELMKETAFRYVYEFDRDGRLTSTFETRTDDGSVDTTWNHYIYDDRNNLSIHRKTDQEGYTSLHFIYDSLDRVISQEYMRDYSDTGSHAVARSLAFNKERFEYFDYDHQTKRTHFNSYDLPYIDEYFNYSESGYLVERLERIKMTSTIYTYTYEYNEKGQLSAIRKASSEQEEYLEEFLFKYDELGNLIEKHIYRNGVFTTDIQIIYNSKSKLLATTITRQVSTGFMMILRFKDYEFYD